MITEDTFVARRQADWDELDRLLARESSVHCLPAASISRAAALYRALTADLVHAHGAGFSGETVAYLDALAARAHNAMYSAPPYRLHAVIELITRDFPRTVRRRARFFALAATLFVVPGLGGFFAARTSARFSAEVLPEEMLVSMEEAYSDTLTRKSADNVLMAGFYVNNNVGIAFRCFATGILFGVGSIYFLVSNGLIIGTLAGMLARTGRGINLLTFCCGHSPFELSAIVISGMAGLSMGYALVATGGRTRWGSLRANARELFHLIVGAAAMLLIAALIEGFWSASPIIPPVKWATAIVLSIMVALYFSLAGRTAPAAAVATARGSR